MIKDINRIYFFDNGNVAVYDSAGNQVPRLQRPFLQLFCDQLEASGVDMSKKFLSVKPDGDKWVRFEKDDDWWVVRYENREGEK